MSRQQRAKIDAMVRRPRPEGAEPEAPASVEELRAGFRVLMAEMLVPAGLTTRTTTLGDRPAVLVEPTGTPRSGTILYFHGGAFVVGSPETAMSLTGNLVTRTRVRSYSLDYRLAPEHPFPAAIDDCLSAYRALLDSGEDPTTIVFAGDSAGGGLAVTTCLAARDAGLPPARRDRRVLRRPRRDPHRRKHGYQGGRRPVLHPRGPGVHRSDVPRGRGPHHPLLSPAVSADLTGLPSMLLQAGTYEVLLDDSTRMATRARDAGVDVILDITADVPHVFQSFAGVLDEADEALDRAAFFIGQRIRGGGGVTPRSEG